MRRAFVLWLLGSALLGLGAGCADVDSHASGDPVAEAVQEVDQVREALERGYAQYIKAFGEADAAGVAGVYDEHGARLYAGSRVVRGRAAIQADVDRFIERVGPVRVTIAIDEVWVMDDTAYETGQWTYTYTPEGEEERASRGRYLTAWKRQADGGWKMWADMSLPGT